MPVIDINITTQTDGDQRYYLAQADALDWSGFWVYKHPTYDNPRAPDVVKIEVTNTGKTGPAELLYLALNCWCRRLWQEGEYVQSVLRIIGDGGTGTWKWLGSNFAPTLRWEPDKNPCQWSARGTFLAVYYIKLQAWSDYP
jgi:hypothetical protein